MTKKEIKKLDNLWKLKVKEDAGFKCEVCGKGTNEAQLHTHHIVGRRHRSLRWVLQNGICLCAEHHQMGLRSAHEDPIWFQDFIREQRGDKWLKEINLLKEKINKKSLEENVALMEKSLGEIINAYELS